jgi:hypothetical protein
MRIVVPLQKWCRKAPKCYVISTLPVLFNMWKGCPSDNKRSEPPNAPYVPSVNCTISLVRKYILDLCKIISNVLLVQTKGDKQGTCATRGESNSKYTKQGGFEKQISIERCEIQSHSGRPNDSSTDAVFYTTKDASLDDFLNHRQPLQHITS